MKKFVLLSGPLAVGKSTITARLVDDHGFRMIASSAYLKDRAAEQNLPISRETLQKIGDRLDVDTDFLWLIEDVAILAFEDNPTVERWLLDSVRKQQQINHFRARFGSAVFHVHLTAPEGVLQERYENRLASPSHNEGTTTYGEATSHSNEQSARGLEDFADLVLDISRMSAADAAAQIACGLGD